MKVNPIFLILLFLLPFCCFAQVTIQGKVLSKQDNKPIADASVFLNNTTIGNKTASDGSFSLSNIKPGKYELVVSCVGFKPQRSKITVSNSNVHLTDIYLNPKSNAIEEVVIKPNPNRKKYFGWFYGSFVEQFFGQTDAARYCKILNPEVLDFDYDESTNTVTVTSNGFLQIENSWLGYKLQYLLTNFKFTIINEHTKELQYEGNALFTEMKGTRQEERRWEKARREAYMGSAVHFLRSALNDQLAENGFRTLEFATYENADRPSDSLIKAKVKFFAEIKDGSDKRNKDSLSYWKEKYDLPKTLQKLMDYPLSKRDIIEPTDQPGLYALGCSMNQLLITYNPTNRRLSPYYRMEKLDSPDNTDNSLIIFNAPFALLDDNGNLIDPASVTYRGIWGRGRMAAFLPLDYEPSVARMSSSDSTLTTLVKQFDSYSSASKDEKVYLHLNKPAYNTTDTIWYKAYVVSGSQHRLSDISGILHVELIDPKDSVILRQTLKLTSGISWGELILPAKLTAGEYRVRAYTNWMRNQPEAYFYNNPIQIGTSVQVISRQNKIGANLDVQFFPEGGELVSGLRSRVAFKAINTSGKGIDINGTIEDNEGNTVAEFASQHLGMGVFALTPEAGKIYRAKISAAGQPPFIVDLPQVRDAGFTLSVDNRQQDTVYIKIAANTKLFESEKNSSFYLVAQSGGRIYYTTLSKLSVPLFLAQVDKARFPSGIVQFTLFSQEGEPLNERVVFVQNDDTLKMKLTGISGSCATRQKVNIGLQSLYDQKEKPIGSFSVSVINEDLVRFNGNAESTILNNLLLTSDLQGYIEQPNYYFTNVDDQKRADLDVLMLTQGFRKFEWKQVLSNSTPEITYKPETDFTLEGAIKTRSGKPVPNGKLTLIASRQNFLTDTVTDANGNFKFTGLNFPDTAKIVLKARKQNNGTNVGIHVKQPDYPQVPKYALEEAVIPTDPEKEKSITNYNNRLKQQDSVIKARELKGVTIRSKSLQKAPDMSHSANLHGGGNADQVIMGDKLEGCVFLSQCLEGRAFGITFKNGVPYNIRMQNKLDNVSDMKIIVDGNVLPGEMLDYINASDVYSVEVLRSVFYLSIYGADGAGGLLIITTKRGAGIDYPDDNAISGLITYVFPGYHKARVFYSPKYDHQGNNDQQFDSRTAIYWNPNLITDKDGKASFEYFNADTKGTYRIVIEGINDDGKIGRAVYRYKVN